MVRQLKDLLLFSVLSTLFFGRSVASGAGPGQSTGPHFSVTPTDAEIFCARVFDEPLVPLDGAARPEENQALASALSAYASRTNHDDCSSLAAYLDVFPNSRWSAPLLLHLGTEYYNYGYFSKALVAWEQAWKHYQTVQYLPAKAQTDRALGELARIYSKLGRTSDLAMLLESTRDRDLQGPATQLIHAARDALWMMQNQPEFCFRCGPLALEMVRLRGKSGQPGNRLILQAMSSTNGCSLAQVAQLSRQVGMNYRMAFRSPGASLIVPSVVHWKVGHYAALLERQADRLLSADFTFRGSVWMTTNAIDHEASGYFLVPPGPLPPGWQAVSEPEGAKIWGRGFVSGQATGATTKHDKTCGGGGDPCAMTVYTMHALLVSLVLNDQPVGYTPPVGPNVFFMASYHQNEANQPATFSYSNLGPKWTCNWLSYVTDNPNSANGDVSIYVDGGGTLNFTGFNTTTASFLLEPMSRSLLVKLSSSSYELQFPDGSRREFSMSDGSTGSSRRIFLTSIIDPSGNVLQLNYDSQLRLTNVVDAIGQATAFIYTNAAYPYAITRVIDPFGRSAYLQYNGLGLLSSITDVLGLISQFTYTTNQFINSLTTPYGTSTFATGQTNGVMYLQATDPLGQSERLEFNQRPVVPHRLQPSEVPHGLSTFNLFMDGRNSFFWDKQTFLEAAGDYTKARVYHWLHYTPNSMDASPVLESERPPLESRIWYNYPGQSTNDGAPYFLDAAYDGSSANPTVVARVLDDGTTQLSFFQYNALGNITNSIDPIGRTFSYIYSTNNVDVLAVRMTRNGKNELIATMTFNSQHLPLTITDASGGTAINTFNSRGQILSTANPKREITSFSYDTNGYLIMVTGPLQNSTDVASFTYDSFGRVHTVSDTEGYTLAFDYDNLDRKTRITYPDGTSDQFVYNRLDLAAVGDRLGRWTTNTYDATRRLKQTIDPLGRTTTFAWCSCGALSSLTDPMGRTTTWRHDAQSRPIAKQYPDGKTITYTYQNSTSLLLNMRDERGQDTVYEYYPDNSLKRVSYPNAVVPTAPVSFTYDADYNRLTAMYDGVGATVFVYNPVTPSPTIGAGKLASASGPLPNSTITYQYDELGRVINCAINGVAQAMVYDSIGRPTTISNSLGRFQFTYVGATDRLVSKLYPNGQTSLYSFYDNVGDQRLKQIQNLKPDGSLLSGFGYSYNATGQITGWTNQWDTIPTKVWLPDYDATDRLTNVVSAGGILAPTNYAYAYDLSGNRVVAASSGIQNHNDYNALNQLANSDAAPTNAATYEWDAESRLTAINQGASRSEFTYDGLGRRVRIIERSNGVAVQTNWFLWCGGELCEIRDAGASTVIRRLYSQGEVLVGPTGETNYFYTRDHLLSIREATDSNGAVAARYDYDPYGRQSAIQQRFPTTFGFTGHFIHGVSGLALTRHRPYDCVNGRWLSRDRLGEAAGGNLYAYAGGDPLNYVDPEGLDRTVYFSGHAWIEVDTYDSQGRVNGRVALNFAPEYPWSWDVGKSDWQVMDRRDLDFYSRRVAYNIKTTREDDEWLVKEWHEQAKNETFWTSWGPIHNCVWATLQFANAERPAPQVSDCERKAAERYIATHPTQGPVMVAAPPKPWYSRAADWFGEKKETVENVLQWALDGFKN